MRCALCGYEFDRADLQCHAACPLADGCAIICCPQCGYQVVDEDQSLAARLLRRWQARRKATPPTQEVCVKQVSLRELKPGDSAEILAIDSVDPARLLRLSALGLAPGSRIRLQQRWPAYVVWVGETQLSLDDEIARHILVDA